MPTSPAPTRLRVCSEAGSVRVAAVAARWRHGGRRPAARATPSPQPKTECPSALAGCPGTSALPRCPITPTTRTRPARSAAEAARHSRSHSPGARAVAGHPDVQVQVHPGGGAGGQAGERDRPQVRLARHGDVDVGSQGGVEVGVDRVEPAEHRGAQPGLAQGERLGEAGDAQPGGAVGEGGTGDGFGPVPEAVGLDHGHQRTGRPGGEEPGVRGDRVQVDPQRRPAREHSDPGRQRRHAATARSTGP